MYGINWQELFFLAVGIILFTRVIEMFTEQKGK